MSLQAASVLLPQHRSRALSLGRCDSAGSLLSSPVLILVRSVGNFSAQRTLDENIFSYKSPLFDRVIFSS